MLGESLTNLSNLNTLLDKYFDDFMDGYCDVLALEVHRRLGLGVWVAIGGLSKNYNKLDGKRQQFDYKNNAFFQHAGNILPNGKLIDVNNLMHPANERKVLKQVAKLFPGGGSFVINVDTGLNELTKFRGQAEFSGDFVPTTYDLRKDQLNFIDVYVNYLAKKYNLTDLGEPISFSSRHFNAYKYFEFMVGMYLGKNLAVDDYLAQSYKKVISKHESYFKKFFRKSSINDLYFAYIKLSETKYYVLTPVETYAVDTSTNIWQPVANVADGKEAFSYANNKVLNNLPQKFNVFKDLNQMVNI